MVLCSLTAPPCSILYNPSLHPSRSYDGAYLAAVMETDAMSTASAATFTLKYTSFDSALFNGARGMINHGTLAKRNVDTDRSTPGAHTPVGGHLVR